MFMHILKYELKGGLRSKDLIIWLILFPIILGTVFKVGFGSIYEKTEKFNSIPVAVVPTSPLSLQALQIRQMLKSSLMTAMSRA